jgi:hypothetical protein
MDIVIPAAPAPCQFIHVRQRHWLVQEATPAPQPGEAGLVRLAWVHDDCQGEELTVLWESEVDPEILNADSWEKLGDRGFDPPDRFAAYPHTLRWSCLTVTDALLFQAPFCAGIRLDAYQLDALAKGTSPPRHARGREGTPSRRTRIRVPWHPSGTGLLTESGSTKTGRRWSWLTRWWPRSRTCHAAKPPTRTGLLPPLTLCRPFKVTRDRADQA